MVISTLPTENPNHATTQKHDTNGKKQNDSETTINVQDTTLKGESLKDAIAPEVDGFIEAIKKKLNDLIIGLKVQLYRIVDSGAENDHEDSHENIVSIDFLFSPKDVLTDYHDELVQKHEDSELKQRSFNPKEQVDQMDSNMFDILNIFKDAFLTHNGIPVDEKTVAKESVESDSSSKKKTEKAESTPDGASDGQDYVKLFDLQHIGKSTESAAGSSKYRDDETRSLHDFLYSISSLWNDMDAFATKF